MGVTERDRFLYVIIGEVLRAQARVEGAAPEVNGVGTPRNGGAQRVHRACGGKQLRQSLFSHCGGKDRLRLRARRRRQSFRRM